MSMSTNKRTISNSDDVIDSRDVIARIEELEEELRDNGACTMQDTEEECACEGVSAADLLAVSCVAAGEYIESANGYVLTCAKCGCTFDLAVAEELVPLQAFAEEGSDNVEDWRHGATLIRDDYFEEYAEELAADIGAIDRNASWPLMYIDWTRAADALKQDYTSIEWDGVTYWGRS